MNRILVVDDHAVVREPLARLLQFEGYRTFCAGNRVEAIALLERESVELILLDLMMPKKDGIAFMECLGADARWRHVPVIVLTGVIEGSLLDRASALSGGNVLQKPRFDVDELFKRIRMRLTASGKTG